MGSLAEAELAELSYTGQADINHSSCFNSGIQARPSARHITVSRRGTMFYRCVSEQRGQHRM